MGIEEVVNLTIDTVASAPSRASFGIPLCMVYHNIIPALLFPISTTKDLTDAGFPVTHPAYLMATKAFSQNPRPVQVIIGKRRNAFTQILELYPVNITEGFHYTFEGVDPAGVVTAIDYAVPNGATVDSVCDALTALIAPMADSVPVATPAGSSSVKIVITTTAGKLTNFRKLPKSQDLKIKDVSTDPGIVADLQAIEDEDTLSWYGITFDHSPRTVIEAAAAHIEASRKLCLVNTSDTECLDSTVTNDVASTLKAASYVRTEILFSASEILSYSALAWLSVMLPKDPGSATWAFKTLRGVSTDILRTAFKNAAKAKCLNTYTNLGGRGATQWGQDPAGGYTDIVLGTDWLYARIQEALWNLFSTSDKIPYTDSGVDSARNVILAVLSTATKPPYNFLAETPEPTVTYPKVADIDPTVRAGRHLPSGEFTGTLQGAIHTVDLHGALSV